MFFKYNFQALQKEMSKQISQLLKARINKFLHQTKKDKQIDSATKSEINKFPKKENRPTNSNKSFKQSLKP